MPKYIEHKDSKKVYMGQNNEKLDREAYITQVAERLTQWSDKILSYDPDLIREDRPDLMYNEDGYWLWRTNMIRQMPEFDMYQVKTILERRNEQKQFNPYMGQLIQPSSRTAGDQGSNQDSEIKAEIQGLHNNDTGHATTGTEPTESSDAPGTGDK